MLRRRSYISQMLFSFLIASVSAGPTNTTGIGPSPSTMPIDITNRCGVDGAMDHEFVVTLKPPAPNSNGRRLDTQDKLSYLQGWVHQYDPEDTANDTTRRKLEANSNSTHVLHLFAVTQLSVVIRADDDVRQPHAQHAPMSSTRPPRRIYNHSRTHVHASDHRAHGQGPGRFLDQSRLPPARRHVPGARERRLLPGRPRHAGLVPGGGRDPQAERACGRAVGHRPHRH